MERDGNVLVGMFWGTVLSVPLWMSIIGWGRLIHRLLMKQ